MADTAASKRGRPKGTRTATVELETVSFKAPKEFVARVRKYAKAHRQSLSELVRDGLEMRLEGVDPRDKQYGTLTSSESTYKGNTSNTDMAGAGVKGLHGMLSALVEEVRQLRESVQTREQQPGRTEGMQASRVMGNTSNSSRESAMPAVLATPPVEVKLSDNNREQQPAVSSYDTAKHHLGKLCPSKHEWERSGQSLRNADNQCLECKAQAKREKRAREKAQREAATR